MFLIICRRFVWLNNQKDRGKKQKNEKKISEIHQENQQKFYEQ